MVDLLLLAMTAFCVKSFYVCFVYNKDAVISFNFYVGMAVCGLQ